jgi:hypothetical protein
MKIGNPVYAIKRDNVNRPSFVFHIILESWIQIRTEVKI